MPAKAAKAAKDSHDAGNANAALAEVATCFMAPMQPHPLCVWPATVKFHALHSVVDKPNQVISSPVYKTGRSTGTLCVL